MTFGFTNDPERLLAVIAWRDAAVADGWTIEPTYPKTETVDQAAKLHRDGWVALVLTRGREGSPHSHRWYYEAQVSVWAPDSLAVRPGDVYSWEALQAATRSCNNCNATEVKTFGYSFAGRCCEACLPAMRLQHEYPGWTR